MREKIGNIIFIIIVGLIIIGAGVAAYFGYDAYRKNQASTTYKDMNKYWGTLAQDEMILLLNHEVTEEKAYYIDGEIYLSLDFVQDSINDRFYYDTEQASVLYMMPYHLERFIPGEKGYYEGDEFKATSYAYIIEKEDALYISLSFIEPFSPVEFQVLENPKRVWVTTDFESDIEFTKVIQEGVIREKGSIKSDILEDIAMDEVLIVIARWEDWSYVMTPRGIKGFISNEAVGEKFAAKNETNYEKVSMPSLTKDTPICLGWYQIFEKQTPGDFLAFIEKADAMNVISPTWYSVTDNEGTIRSIADKEFVDIAHEKGLQVWALVENINYATGLDNVKLLSSYKARQNMISQLIGEVKAFGIDGLNVDFEALSSECGTHYVEFLRELSIACRTEKIILSIDNYVPAAYNMFYNRAEQGDIADYVIIMGYDEHYNGSKPGSTASLPFVKEGIDNTLKEVPANKVINAIPFYTRLWRFEQADASMLDSDLYEDATWGKGILTSESKNMATSKALLTSYCEDIKWLEEENQYFGEYELEGYKYRMWLEDIKSLEAKIQYGDEQNLAGLACWKLGLETEDVWPLIKKYSKAQRFTGFSG